MERVAYIIENKKGFFKPFLADACPSEGDNDSSLFAIASGKRCEKLNEAQEFLRSTSGHNGRTFLNPIKSNEMGISWLSELEAVNDNNSIIKPEEK